jgi:hypothetical protein
MLSIDGPEGFETDAVSAPCRRKPRASSHRWRDRIEAIRRDAAKGQACLHDDIDRRKKRECLRPLFRERGRRSARQNCICY